MSSIRQERALYKEHGSKAKDAKIAHTAQIAGFTGLAAGLGGAALAGRGVNAGRGAAWAAKNARGRKGVTWLATKTGARVPNQKFERAVTGWPQAAVGGYGGAVAGNEISGRKQYKGYRRTQYGLAPVGRNKKSQVTKSMSTVSVWGVDHLEEVSKKAQREPRENASFGRMATAAVFPGWHAAAAGRKGKKLRAAGYELGGALVVPAVGGGVGAHFAHKEGYYKNQKVHKAFTPVLARAAGMPKIPKPPTGPSVANGLKQIGGMAKPTGVPTGASQGQFGAAASRIKGRSRFNAGQQSALGNRLGVRKNMESSVGVSVWGVDHGPEDISKDLVGNKSLKSQGAAFAQPGARRRAGKVAGREGAFFSPNGTNRSANWHQLGRSTARGAGIGAGAGAVVGTALTRRRSGAVVGGTIGAEVGAMGGSFHAQEKIGTRARAKAWNAGVKSGDIQTGLKSNQITAFSGRRQGR